MIRPSDRYDAVIVRAGLVDLVTVAYLARDGFRVLLCEQNERVGGCFKRGGGSL